MLNKKYLLGGVYSLWMLTLTVLSVIPIQQTFVPDVPFIDKYEHAVVYFIATFLCFLYITSKGNTKLNRNTTLKIIAFHITYGLVLELVQHYFVSGRFGEFYDFLANSIGVVLGCTTFFLGFKQYVV